MGKTFGDIKISRTFASLLKRKRFGRLAQLVQSVCLTSRGSAVRIRQRPPKRFFLFPFSKRPGRLAQLVQSVCLTSRGSAVRIRQRPPKKIPFQESVFRKDLGRLAQLVQSVCLTSRGSAVRIRQRPQLLYPKNAIIGSPASDCRAIFFVLIRRGCERLLPPCGQESVQSSSSPYSVPVGSGGVG